MTEKYFGENLLFIISQPRSGSTLLQRILSGHPQIQTSAETWIMLHPAYALKSSGLDAEYNSSWALEGVKDFLTNYTDGMEVYNEAIREWARIIYGNALSKSGKKYFLDKTPRYFFIIPELYQLFPRAKFIFLIRNPMAVLASELTTYVKGDWPVLGLFRPDLLSAPTWILDGIKLLGQDAITIHYEKFVSSPNEHISSLCTRLDIEFLPEMLDYARTKAPIGKMNDPVGIYQHTKPVTININKWKDMAHDPQSCHFAREYLNALGSDVFTRLGYSYEEALNVFSQYDSKINDHNIFPWHVAIRPKKDWTYRNWLMAEHYYCVKRRGRFLGMLATIKRGTKRILHTLKQVLS